MQNVENILDELHLKDLQNDKHPSYFDINDGYNMFIIRLPIFEDKLRFQSFGFIFTKHTSYFYNIEEKTFQKFNNRFREPYEFINSHINDFMKNFIKYQETIQEMEELLYSDHDTKDFMSTWFGLKRDITRVESVLEKALYAMTDFIEHYEIDATNEGFLVNNYADLHEHLERSKHSSTLQLSKLDYIYNFYNTRTNERMNRLIYILTIISAVFLPLNLLVGFFGMNTTDLPFTAEANGTKNVIMTMTVVFIISSIVVLFWKKKA
ncbi:magnesium transporter [bacterium]|jgi:magnesium transporter|nr:magnesium transporter [bacterium]MBU1435373.1 magnesium transporter [bacterium]MBU1502316.1 magnesium transporter [bacterium]